MFVDYLFVCFIHVLNYYVCFFLFFLNTINMYLLIYVVNVIYTFIVCVSFIICSFSVYIYIYMFHSCLLFVYFSID